jgi:hypothetical protein
MLEAMPSDPFKAIPITPRLLDTWRIMAEAFRDHSCLPLGSFNWIQAVLSLVAHVKTLEREKEQLHDSWLALEENREAWRKRAEEAEGKLH